ncbi:MAG: hypothetical protein JNJ65_17925 [Cyclobacteriaceae bacterium]|nr:hypothetical protein [Cyclobacteriaceae bacterium]
MTRKIIYLLVALLMPGIIFVFLKFFGKNEFTIPVYYEQGVAEVAGTCAYRYPTPYRVPDSIMSRVRKDGEPEVVLVIANPSNQIKANLSRLKEQVNDYHVSFASEAELPWDAWFGCFFFLHKPWSAVLIDSENQIRGYYDPETREEVDRLAVEMKILLMQY